MKSVPCGRMKLALRGKEVADEWHAEQVLGGSLVMRTFGSLTHRWQSLAE